MPARSFVIFFGPPRSRRPFSRPKAILRLEELEERALWHAGLPHPIPQAADPVPAQTLAEDDPPLPVRENQSALTPEKRQRFVNAVKQLKRTFRPDGHVSIYDEYVVLHQQAFSGGHAHGGPAFVAWHRQYLRNFEKDLQVIDPKVTIPYWDFTVDNQPTSSIWAADFMGGSGDPKDSYVVKDGPFRQGQWYLIWDGPHLQRSFGLFADRLPTRDDVLASFEVGSYDAAPYDFTTPVDQSFRNHVEGFSHLTGDPEMHNRVHLWIGGSMSIVNSPNDPVFWLLHAYLDKVWAEWQARPEPDYLPESGAREGHNLHDPMSPFDVTPATVLDHHGLGYRYDTELGRRALLPSSGSAPEDCCCADGRHGSSCACTPAAEPVVGATGTQESCPHADRPALTFALPMIDGAPSTAEPRSPRAERSPARPAPPGVFPPAEESPEPGPERRTEAEKGSSLARKSGTDAGIALEEGPLDGFAPLPSSLVCYSP